MKELIAQIKTVVPRGVRIASTIVFAVAVAVAVVLAFLSGVSDAQATAHPGVRAVFLSGIAVLAGIIVALWLMALGYIYVDAKRRGMPPVLWLAVVILVPNMIGFILYFALRKPLLSACANCGQGVMPGQKFCPSCGREQGTNSPSSPTSSTGSISLNRQSDGLAQKSFAIGLSVWVVIFAAKGMLAYWRHATADAGGLLILAGIGALLVWFIQPRQLHQPIS